MENILFLDIETVPAYPSFNHVPDDWKMLWSRKAENLKKAEHEQAADIYNRAGIYAEFGKIICISTGFVREGLSGRELRIKSFYGDNEQALLTEFAGLLNAHFSRPDSRLCAHNGREFDFPYLSRRRSTVFPSKCCTTSITNTSGNNLPGTNRDTGFYS